MSGTGKSSVLHEQAARGYPTVDTDYGGYFETVDGERLWREDRINALLSSDLDELPGVLFVQGTTRNQVLFYPCFDHIVLLSAPPDVLVERLTTRTTKSYGKDPAELTELVRQRMSYAIYHQLRGSYDDLAVLNLDPRIENQIATNIAQGASHGLIIEPRTAEALMRNLINLADAMHREGRPPVLVCANELRRHIKKFTRRSIPKLSVLSLAELPDRINLTSFDVVRAEA